MWDEAGLGREKARGQRKMGTFIMSRPKRKLCCSGLTLPTHNQ